jgi:hypothetical protein
MEIEVETKGTGTEMEQSEVRLIRRAADGGLWRRRRA